MSPTLESVRIQAELLASSCLSEPWSETEKKIAVELPSWQHKLVESEKEITGNSDVDLKEVGEELNEALKCILSAIQAKDAVSLSNALANQFAETLNTLDRLISNS